MAIKHKKSDDFYAGLCLLAAKRQFPLRVLFELTYSCNFECIHCYNAVEKNKKELDTSQVKEILRYLQKAGSFHVGFTGGEPLVREDIFEILDYAKSLGFRITILTNGYLVNKKTADMIASLGTNLNKVDISFLGADKGTFESITQKKESFTKVKTAIQLLRKRDVDIMIKFTLMKQNKAQLKEIRQMAQDNDCMFKFSPTINARANGDKSPLGHRLSPQEVMMYSGEGLKQRYKEAPDLKSQYGTKKLFRCGAGRSEVSINPYGELKLCPEISQPAYSVLDFGLQAAWSKIKNYVKELENKDYICKRCDLASSCDSCPARMFTEEGGLGICNKYDHERALLRARAMQINDYQSIRKISQANSTSVQ